MAERFLAQGYERVEAYDDKDEESDPVFVLMKDVIVWREDYAE